MVNFSKIDHILFVKKKESSDSSGIYLIVTSDGCKGIKKFKRMFAIEFELKDMRKLRHFLDIEVVHSMTWLILNQKSIPLIF